MTEAVKHIRHFNRMNGNPVSKETLKKLLSKVTGVPGCEELKTVLNKAITKMNGHKGTDRLEFTPLKVPVVIPVIKKEGSSVVKKVPVKTIVTKPVFRLVKNDVEPKKPESPKPVVVPSKAKSVDGFTSADQVPASVKTFRWPTEVGEFLQNMQRYKLAIVIHGPTHSSKSELAKQITAAALEAGEEVGSLEWEQGALQSRDTVNSINRNIPAHLRKNLHISDSVPRTIPAVKALADKFTVVVIDSGSKIDQISNAWIDELREEFPKTIWIILMQQNDKGKARGGASAQYDAPIVIETNRPDHSDYRKNYAYLFKNRGNETGWTYNIFKKEIDGHDVG